MAFQPADTLRNRTFSGLIVAQFLAGFNDQAIHAASMFYAIHQGILTEAQAISLMPILFYAPWALFCTLAGYFADRFSKTTALVLWKMAEIAIAVVALGGFYLGSVLHEPVGAWLVLSAVFLMGTHAAFFAPAKYGAMPEMLQAHVLSRGNGILESTTFLAAILGTVSGGLLSEWFRDREWVIGGILLLLAIIGAIASLMIERLPAANPERLFPRNLLKPLFQNLGTLLRSKPLILAVLGIAFFIFMVSYMRAAMYMHGETRNPRWSEFKTSLVVATVALGVGLGTPLAGFLSGGKVELGLVPLGTLGMAVALSIAAAVMDWTSGLVVILIILGFCSGFYMVPLYTLLQHRAPKTSKGDLIATSNFINVTGAMAASLLFFVLVLGSQRVGLTPQVPQKDNVAAGILVKLGYNKEGRPAVILIEEARTGVLMPFRAKSVKQADDEEMEAIIVDVPTSFEDGLFELAGGGLSKGDEVVISSYDLHDARHYRIRRAGTPLKEVYDNEKLPRYLFLGAALMALGILLLLCRQLPDFITRSAFWLRSLGRFRIRVAGMQHLPTRGPVILASNCATIDSALQVVSATDRCTRFILVENEHERAAAPVVRLVSGTSFHVLKPGPIDETTLAGLLEAGRQAVQRDDLLAVGAPDAAVTENIQRLLADLTSNGQTTILPVYCGPVGGDDSTERRTRGRVIHVIFGPQLKSPASAAEIARHIEELAAHGWHNESNATPH